jgi:hypothetical protein
MLWILHWRTEWVQTSFVANDAMCGDLISTTKVCTPECFWWSQQQCARIWTCTKATIIFNRFVPEKFEALFSKYAKTDKHRLHFNELFAMTQANRNAYDPFGWWVNKWQPSIFWQVRLVHPWIDKKCILLEESTSWSKIQQFYQFHNAKVNKIQQVHHQFMNGTEHMNVSS